MIQSKFIKPVKLLNRNFVLLWQGQFVTFLGTNAFAIAILFWLKHQTGSASLMGLLLMAHMIPGVIFGPIGGVFADRYSRWKIIVFGDLIRGILILGFAVLVFVLPDEVDTTVFALFVVGIISGIIVSIFNPAVSASIPQIVPPEKLGTANSMMLFSMQITNSIGQGIGGILFRLLGAPVMFLINGIFFIFSSISEMFIKIPQEFSSRDNASGENSKIVQELMEGLRFIFNNRGMTYILFGSSIVLFLIIPLIVLFPFFVEDYLKATADWYGYLLAGNSAGTIIGFIVGGKKIPGRIRSNLIIIFLFISMGLWGGLGLVTDKTIALIFMILCGIFNGFVNVSVITILQQTTPDRIRGRVFSVFTTINTGLVPLGMGLVGIVADLLDQNIPLMFVSAAAISLIIVLICASSREYRDYLAFEILDVNEEMVEDQ